MLSTASCWLVGGLLQNLSGFHKEKEVVGVARVLPVESCLLHHAGSKPLSIDYIYSKDASQLGMRVSVDLAVLDGVTAMRVAMNTLELLEGHVAPSDASAFKKNPPFTYGWRHRLNFARMMAGVLSGIALAHVFRGNKQGASANGALGSHVSAIVPNSCSSMLAYHALTRVDGKAQSTGTFRTFRVDDSTKKPYKAFLKVK
jgi:hypothetical protein